VPFCNNKIHRNFQNISIIAASAEISLLIKGKVLFSCLEYFMSTWSTCSEMSLDIFNDQFNDFDLNGNNGLFITAET
jgi:hypothetical protein